MFASLLVPVLTIPTINMHTCKIFPSDIFRDLKIMSAYVKREAVLACKMICMYPENIGIPTIQGLMCLLNPSTGTPLAVSAL